MKGKSGEWVEEGPAYIRSGLYATITEATVLTIIVRFLCSPLISRAQTSQPQAESLDEAPMGHPQPHFPIRT